MAKFKRLVFLIFILVLFFKLDALYAAQDKKAVPAKEAAKVASDISKTKKAQQSKEKEMFDYFYKQGLTNFKSGKFSQAVDFFAKALEINPEDKAVYNYLVKSKEKAQSSKLTKEQERELKKKSYLSEGKAFLREGNYDKALDNFGEVLALDTTNKEAVDLIEKAKRMQLTKDARTEAKNMKKDLAVTVLEKENVEQSRMLEVEKSYLPPEKPLKQAIEVEELATEEGTKEEEDRKKLLEELQKKIVPAVSLTDADIKDVIRQLMDMTGVTIVIDEKALAEINQGAPLKLTFNTVSSMPLLDLLDIALKTSNLSYRIEPTYVWISTPAKLKEENLVTKTYKLKYGVRRIRKVELEKFETKSGTSQ